MWTALLSTILILTERFITRNKSFSTKRKELELERLQNPNLELKFEVKVKFQGLNPHPIFHVAKKKNTKQLLLRLKSLSSILTVTQNYMI